MGSVFMSWDAVLDVLEGVAKNDFVQAATVGGTLGAASGVCSYVYRKMNNLIQGKDMPTLEKVIRDAAYCALVLGVVAYYFTPPTTTMEQQMYQMQLLMVGGAAYIPAFISGYIVSTNSHFR